MTIKHTPGPWKVRMENDSMATVFRQTPAGEQRITRAGTVFGEENAALIAAAPELLEACKAAQKYLLLPEGQRGDVREILQLLGKAGIKAEGLA